MSCTFGIIQRAELLNDELILTGHNYVALAFDRDDPYIITRFVGVDGALPQDEIELLSSASDIYDCATTESKGVWLVHFRLNDEIDIHFRCTQVVTECRYYTSEEVKEILTWLPSKCTDQQLHEYIAALHKHGLSATVSDTAIVVTGI